MRRYLPGGSWDRREPPHEGPSLGEAQLLLVSNKRPPGTLRPRAAPACNTESNVASSIETPLICRFLASCSGSPGTCTEPRGSTGAEERIAAKRELAVPATSAGGRDRSSRKTMKRAACFANTPPRTSPSDGDPTRAVVSSSLNRASAYPLCPPKGVSAPPAANAAGSMSVHHWRRRVAQEALAHC